MNKCSTSVHSHFRPPQQTWTQITTRTDLTTGSLAPQGKKF